MFSLNAALSLPLGATERSQGLVSSILEILTLDYDSLPPVNGLDESQTLGNTTITCSIVRVCQRIKLEESHNRPMDEDAYNRASWEESSTVSSNKYMEDTSVIWALIEYELSLPDGFDTASITTILQTLKQQRHSQSYRFLRWKRFNLDNQLMDHIRRDRGEPVYLPPYSLTPQQAIQVTADAKKHVESITEDYRKFRVKAEIARKQAEETIRMLQQNQVQFTHNRFTAVAEAAASSSHLNHSSWHEAKSFELERLQNEMMQQEYQWKNDMIFLFFRSKIVLGGHDHDESYKLYFY